MAICVERAVKVLQRDIPKDEQLDMYSNQLPEGFPFLMDDDSLEIHLAALDYMVDRFLGTTPYRSLHTVEAAAYDLCDFLRYCEAKSLDWRDVTHDDILDYRQTLFGKISPLTAELLHEKTVGRKVSRTIDWVSWGLGGGYMRSPIRVDPQEARALRKRSRGTYPVDRRKEMDSESGPANIADLKVSVHDDMGEHVHPLAAHEWNLVKALLGPLPNGADALFSAADGPGSFADSRGDGLCICRNRVASEFSLATGARVSEVTSLTKFQILDLRLTAEMLPHDVLPLKLRKTKGNKSRKIEVPVWLVRILHLYIDGERADAIREGRRWRGRTADTASLFVNGVSARRHAGEALKPDVLSAAFRDAVAKAGLTRTVEKIDEESNKTFWVKVPAHGYHDLRHTFAVWRYEAERAAGNAAPWKIVQLLLGHADVFVTMQTYLKTVGSERKAVNAAVFRGVRKKFGTGSIS